MLSAIKSAFTTEIPKPPISLTHHGLDGPYVENQRIPLTDSVFNKYISLHEVQGPPATKYSIKPTVTNFYHINDEGVKSITTALNRVGFKTSVYSDPTSKNVNIGITKNGKEVASVSDEYVMTKKVITLRAGTFDTPEFEHFNTIYNILVLWANGKVGGKKRKTHKQQQKSRKTKRHTRR